MFTLVYSKELKKWLENINDDSLISINTYKNNHEKNFIIATQFNEDGKIEVESNEETEKEEKAEVKDEEVEKNKDEGEESKIVEDDLFSMIEDDPSEVEKFEKELEQYK